MTSGIVSDKKRPRSRSRAASHHKEDGESIMVAQVELIAERQESRKRIN